VLAIRRLAGGIAHEFNNLMTVVIGGTEEEFISLPVGAPQRAGLARVREAGARAAALTKRLQTYAGGSSAPRTTVSLAALVREMDGAIREAAGAGITMEYEVAAPGPTIFIDRPLVEECVLHLVRNAREAMRGAGTIGIAVHELRVDRQALADAVLPAPSGQYVVLAVRDHGSGMDPAMIARNFDPFVSSRSPAEATGLGLAVVHGAMATHRGGITVESTAEAGTTVRLFFPAPSTPARAS
jgi:signal transduction histidine kinase